MNLNQEAAMNVGSNGDRKWLEIAATIAEDWFALWRSFIIIVAMEVAAKKLDSWLLERIVDVSYLLALLWLWYRVEQASLSMFPDGVSIGRGYTSSRFVRGCLVAIVVAAWTAFVLTLLRAVSALLFANLLPGR